MIPHERSLVEKWKDKPFALIGVNSDGTNSPKKVSRSSARRPRRRR
jgi:hypothetical protein